jgi:hypothetical protein
MHKPEVLALSLMCARAVRYNKVKLMLALQDDPGIEGCYCVCRLLKYFTGFA